MNMSMWGGSRKGASCAEVVAPFDTFPWICVRAGAKLAMERLEGRVRPRAQRAVRLSAWCAIAEFEVSP